MRTATQHIYAAGQNPGRIERFTTLSPVGFDRLAAYRRRAIVDRQ